MCFRPRAWTEFCYLHFLAKCSKLCLSRQCCYRFAHVSNVTFFTISAAAALASMCCGRTISISWSNATFGTMQRSNSSFECGFCNAGVHTATNMWWKASLRAETLSDPWRGPPPSRALSLTLSPPLLPLSLFPFSFQRAGRRGLLHRERL